MKITTRFPEYDFTKGLPDTQISRISGRLVSLAISIGSVSVLSRRSNRSNERSLSIPANERRRFPRRLRAVMAGRGLRDKECKDSIMQCERFNARKATKDAKLSGTSVKRFDDRSKDCNVFATGARLAVVIAVKELSGRPRCRRNRHLDGGRIAESRFEELVEFRQWPEVSLEFELPEPVRLIREWR